MPQTAKSYPSTGFGDLLRLLGRSVGTFPRGPRSFDFSSVLQDWLGSLARRTGSENVILDLYFKKILVVKGRELSEHILSLPPDVRSYVEGTTKARAMSFLAPHALTIAHGEKWQRLRRFNEAALHTREEDGRMQFILDGVREAFPEPVSDIGDIRRCMAQTMRTVALGSDRPPAHLTEDVQTLVRYVQSPARRTLFGWRQVERRERFYDALRRLWEESSERDAYSLIAAARGMIHSGAHSEEEIIQQIPHWMFTFTGSGTDLLARTLGIVASRDDVHSRVQDEATEQSATKSASAMMNMEYLDACLLETCRLFPPVTRTFHVAPRGDTFDGFHIPAGMEILHFFTASQRDTSVDPTANDFRPERWTESGGNAAAVYPSLFLGGARDCPGKDLILFVCKAAISMLVKQGRIRSQCPDLSEDPMPYSFPESGLRFSTDRH